VTSFETPVDIRLSLAAGADMQAFADFTLAMVMPLSAVGGSFGRTLLRGGVCEPSGNEPSINEYFADTPCQVI
jgi:uncharacterized membrane protein YedE/YeeE